LKLQALASQPRDANVGLVEARREEQRIVGAFLKLHHNGALVKV
jgi:hypothetical protein